METAVLIHGCHLQAKAWDDIIWGNPQNGRLGRVPKGIMEAIKWTAKTIVFSTGASEKDGLKEGEYIYRYTLEHVGELTDITGMHKSGLLALLHRAHVLELTSVDTRSEVLASARLAKERKAEELILVSSKSHIMRCHKEAISAFEKNPDVTFFLKNLYAVAADTTYADTNIDDVFILEPPHRGDRPDVPIYKNAARINTIRRNPALAERFNQEFGNLLDQYGV